MSPALTVSAPDAMVVTELPVRATVHERVRETLRHRIVSGVLKPGEHLRQSALAVQLQVSVAPVREALRDLAAEGYVRFDPRRGASVRTVDLEEFLEIRLLLETFEPVAARLAVQHVTPGELARVRSLQEELEGVTTVARYSPLDVTLHEVLTTSTRSPRLQGILESLDGAAHLLMAAALEAVPERIEQAIVEH
ncbi:MAG: GntR family transcriptional regulator, partial [Janthinobacterium lividum]